MSQSFSTTTATKVTTVLTGTADWDSWYTIIKGVAEGKLIWEYINPETPQELCPTLIQPVKPVLADVNADAQAYTDLNTTERDAYKFLTQEYKSENDEYKVLNTAIAGYKADILRSLSPSILLYIQNCKGTYDTLVKLCTQFAPTDRTWEQMVLAQYQKIKKVPRTKNLELWLHSWEKTYQDVLDIGLPDVQGNRPVKDFVRSLQDTDPSFHTYWTHHLCCVKEYPSLKEVIYKFCTHLQEDPTSQTVGHGAFSASFQDQAASPPGVLSEKQCEKLDVPPTDRTNSSTKRGNQDCRTECLCGKMHCFADCPYLVESKRGCNWIADEEISRMICEKMERSKGLTQAVERACNRGRSAQSSREPSREHTDQAEEPAGIPASFTADIVGGAAYSTDLTGRTDYVLRDSFILDCGATTHVCNNRQRFHTFTPASDSNLYTGDRTIAILGFGTVDITVQLPQGRTKTASLSDVAYVPSFQTSTVSYRCFEDVGGHWDTQSHLQMLMYKTTLYAITEMRYGQYVIEYNPLKEASTQALPPQASVTDSATDSATNSDLTHTTSTHTDLKDCTPDCVSDSAPTDSAPTSCAPTGCAPTDCTPDCVLTGSAPTGSALTDCAPTSCAPTGCAPTGCAPTGCAPPAPRPPAACSPTARPPTARPPAARPPAARPPAARPTACPPTARPTARPPDSTPDCCAARSNWGGVCQPEE